MRGCTGRSPSVSTAESYPTKRTGNRTDCLVGKKKARTGPTHVGSDRTWQTSCAIFAGVRQRLMMDEYQQHQQRGAHKLHRPSSFDKTFCLARQVLPLAARKEPHQHPYLIGKQAAVAARTLRACMTSNRPSATSNTRLSHLKATHRFESSLVASSAAGDGRETLRRSHSRPQYLI